MMSNFFTFFLLFILLPFSLNAQGWGELSPMPERVTNNAVTAAQVNGEWYVYSFAGMDSTKSCEGDHLRSWRYSLSADSWESIPDVPDPLGGKIAAGASVIKGKIYVVGGYHITPDCNELSSAKIHIFDPVLNEWLPDGADLPLPIDDQVQAVWNDSLLYVVTGWSNTTNVEEVQIYNPTTDSWLLGTPIPGLTSWKVFGASGVILGDTLYYAGGATLSGSFNASNAFRKGAINPNDPAQIEWSTELDILSRGYRMGASRAGAFPFWVGGSLTTYNFDGVAYNGSGGVEPEDRAVFYDRTTGQLYEENGFFPPIMDLRGVAKIGATNFITAGGMLAGQEVTNRVFLSEIVTTAVRETGPEAVLTFFPNPTTDRLCLDLQEPGEIALMDAFGRVVFLQSVQSGDCLDVSKVESGVYFLQFKTEKGARAIGKLIISVKD